MMPENSSTTLTLGGQVFNVHLEIAEKTEPEPIPEPVAVESREEPKKRGTQNGNTSTTTIRKDYCASAWKAGWPSNH